MPIRLPFDKISGFSTLLGHLEDSSPQSVSVSGLWGTSSTLLAADVALRLNCPLLYLVKDHTRAEDALDELAFYCGSERVHLLPPWNVVPDDEMPPSNEVMAERMNVLVHLLRPEPQSPPVLVASARAFTQKVVPPDFLRDQLLPLEVGMETSLTQLQQRLHTEGYERAPMVEARGEFAVRGGICDIFSVAAEDPIRIEFFGDEIVSMRAFDPVTQRSLRTVDCMEVLPRSESDLNRELGKSSRSWASVLDYLSEEALVAWEEKSAIESTIDELAEQLRALDIQFSTAEVAGLLRSRSQLFLTSLGGYPDGIPPSHRFQAPMRSLSEMEGHPDEYFARMQKWVEEGCEVHVLCSSEGEGRRLAELMSEHGLSPSVDPGEGSSKNKLQIHYGRVRGGFFSEEMRLALVCSQEIFARRHRRRTRRFHGGIPVASYTDLNPGDYVVHIDHGIGIYRGIQYFEDQKADFIHIEYAQRDKLYIPIWQVNQLQKFQGPDGAGPAVHRLGGSDWHRTRSRVKKGVQNIAEDLIALYAKRLSTDGHTFPADSVWQTEFEDSFTYEETPDQRQAIESVKKDMESHRPMDRLICGDVGFGKTEVALRGAFKAMEDGKQVVLLVPTTILAQQHYNTFRGRLADYPFVVEMLSRFRSRVQQKEIIKKLAEGKIDIIIGTHRLLSKDISFRELGLVIVDEEHRFGVKQKERLKQLRAEVDTIALSATPIPRTLHLSLMNVRDISLIRTPPVDRLPIVTQVVEFNEEIIQKALQREFAREGQAFFVHNRIETIYPVAGHLQRLLPDARLAVAHGRMHERDLEEVMEAFVDREIDLLVTTSIIESGLDIPNANTTIINQAHRFGLADLYQLRGRVGRDKYRAYAYLLVPPRSELSRVARRRLRTLQEFSDLGVGFQIALRDLEIRGAGNLFGAEQHGHVASVGFEMYCQIIEEAVLELRGEKSTQKRLASVDLGVPAFLPKSYISSQAQKISFYERIARMKDPDEGQAIREELKDRYGPVPPQAHNLLKVMELRILAGKAGVDSIVREEDGYLIRLESTEYLTPTSLSELSRKYRKHMELRISRGPVLVFHEEGMTPEKAEKCLKEILIDLERYGNIRQ